MDLVQAEGDRFPHSLQLELESLLDEETLISKEIAKVEREISKLEMRIHDALATSELAESRLRQGVSLKEIVKEAEKKYPYDLNSQKPLSTLIDSIAPSQREWELRFGNKRRDDELWAPLRQMYKSYLAELRKLPRVAT